MPPRYAYWTILVDNQPTAFRAGAKEDLLPTFNRLKSKDPSAVMMWFQNGKLWPSRVDAQEAMLARGEMGRRGDARQGGFRERHKVGANFSSPAAERKPRSDRSERPEWKPKTHDARPKTQDSRPKTSASDKLDWKPKGTFTPAPKRSERSDRPDWKPKASFDRDRKPRSFARPAWKPSGDETKAAKPEWKPKGSFTRERKPDWKPKGSFDRERKPEWRSKTSTYAKAPVDRQDSRPRTSRPERPEWKPKTSSPQDLKTSEKRKWVPKEEYKKSLGIEAKRDEKWRPGGAHRDPRQKYKDAKKAKWTKFKKTIRSKWEGKSKKKS